MRQIIPFKKELLFKTKVSEITSISLEHTLYLKESNLISGEFHISGDYKMTSASINREKFYFTLPFEINLDDNYVGDNINIDIDNFYYEIVNDDSLQVNIDVYIDGEKEKKEVVINNSETKESKVVEEVLPEVSNDDNERADTKEVDSKEVREEVPTIVKEDEIKIEKVMEEPKVVVLPSKEETLENRNSSKENVAEDEIKIDNNISFANSPQIKIDIDNDNVNENENENKNKNIDELENVSNNINFFNTDNFNTDTYVTYYVYIVKEDDTLNSIMEKFNVSKEKLGIYNDLSDLKKGTKIIIPMENE